MSDIQTEVYVNDDAQRMEVRIDGDEVAITTYTDGVQTGWEIETLDRWSKFQPERESDGWRRES